MSGQNANRPRSDTKVKRGINDRIAMFNQIHTPIGAPAPPPSTAYLDKKDTPNEKSSESCHNPKIHSSILEKAAFFEGNNKQERTFPLRNLPQNATRTAESQNANSPKKISTGEQRVAPLISSNTPGNQTKPTDSNRQTAPPNKYKEDFNKKKAFYEVAFKPSNENLAEKKTPIKEEVPSKSTDAKKVDENPQIIEAKKVEESSINTEIKKVEEKTQTAEIKKEEEKPKETEVPNKEQKAEPAEKVENNVIDLKDFKKLKKLGKGGFGTVFRVQNIKTGAIYAAKISNDSIKPTNYSKMLNIYREVNICARTNHPAILKFIGYSEVDFKGKNKPIIINEFAPNGSLDDVLALEAKGEKVQGWDDTKKLINIYGIASGMAFLNKHRIVHRDLKPENILLDEYLFPKIADFGLAKQIHDNEYSITLQSNAGFKGTPLFQSPELMEDVTMYSEASDVYAFGLIVYEIVDGLRKPETRTAFKYNCDVINGWRPPFRKQISESYKELITACWNGSPDLRPTFQEIVEKLETEQSFLTDKINKEDYKNYINFIKESNTAFDKNKKIIELKGKAFQKVQLDIKYEDDDE